MEFAKYYNVTNKLNEMLERKETILFSYTKDYCKGLFICEDTHDIWICRILEGYNEDYEQEEGKYLIERNKIDKYEFCEFLQKQINDDSEIDNRRTRDYYIDECFSINDVIENIILMDDDNGLENWDIKKCNSYEEAINVLDDGYGIIELTA